METSVKLSFIILAILSCASLILSIVLGASWHRTRRVPNWTDGQQVVVTINKAIIRTEVSSGVIAKARGLSGRPFLDQNSGMLFVFPYPQQLSFWMNGMLFDLDFIWINNGTVVSLNERIPSPQNNNGAVARVLSGVESVMVLEVPAGTISTYEIAVGQPVHIAR